jgi:flagellar motor switch protein FliN/FliY
MSISKKDSKNSNFKSAKFNNFDEEKISIKRKNINMLMDVPINLTVELGRTNKKIKEILELNPGSIIELDNLAGEAVNILVNGKVIAKGEVVVVGENFGVRIIEINKSKVKMAY